MGDLLEVKSQSTITCTNLGKSVCLKRHVQVSYTICYFAVKYHNTLILCLYLKHKFIIQKENNKDV